MKNIYPWVLSVVFLPDDEESEKKEEEEEEAKETKKVGCACELIFGKIKS
jgi:hypothetical protein